MEERARHEWPGRRLRQGTRSRRDPSEEPPSEERYGAEGRSPGLRVIAVVPAFPSLVQSPVTRNGTAAHRLQLRGQRRTLPRRAPPASRLSPTITPEVGNLDTVFQHHRSIIVKDDIKISLYDSFRRLSQ